MVLLNDLLDDADRAELGFRAPFTDTLSILEQCLMMRSAAFFGDVRLSLIPPLLPPYKQQNSKSLGILI